MKDVILPEIIAAGIYDSRIAAKNKAVSKKRKTTMFEIELPCEKGGTAYIDNQESDIDTDMIICVKRGQLRNTRFPFKCYYIHIILNEGQLYDTLMKLPNFIKTKKAKKYKEIFIKICKYCDSAFENERLLVHSLILELAYMLASDCGTSFFNGKAKNSNHAVIEDAVRYIKENISADLSLEYMAERASFSPIHFHNCFKASTGRTLRKFVEEERIKKAVNLLTTTDMTLADISYECGFSSQSYFSYAFKRSKGMTPREYAREIFRRYEN